MIDRRSLRFRLTLLYWGAGFVVLATLGLVCAIAIFAYEARPIAQDFADSVRGVEASVAQAPRDEPVEVTQRRIVVQENAKGVVVAAISALAMREAPGSRPAGEISVGGLFGLSPVFLPVRESGIVLFPAVAQTSRFLRAFYLAIGGVLVAAASAAWLLARWGTRETLRPVLTVTAELERFAGGDFSPRPLSAFETEFDALAAAYNGAARKVSEAFLERRKVEEHIRQFVADAGHELRTPLTVIAGYIDVLRRGAFDDPAIRREAFASLTIEIKRMRTLVERLMTLARLDRELAAEPEVVDVGVIVRQAVDALAVIAQTPITLDAPRDLLVLGEPVDLYEAVANLLENAVKYGERTPVAVAVEAAGSSIAVRVRDGGAGIAEADRARIFERFYRGADRSEIGGSGLGLAIAAKAAERLGGRIVLENATAGATTFALVVPALNGMLSQSRPAPPRA